MREHGFEFRFQHIRAGEVIYDSGFLPNQVSDEGFEQMYDIYFRGQTTVPSGFEIGLTKSAPTQSSDIAAIALIEPDNATEGYARQTVERSNTGFPTLALDASDMQVVTKEVEFENTDAEESWEAVTHGFMSAVMADDDKFVCWRALSAERTLEPDDKLKVTIKIKGEQPAA